MSLKLSPKTVLTAVTPYITKDGSQIRELLHPSQHAVRQQSLAEAVIPVGTGTPHCVENTGQEALHILCCCAPAYAHDDTELL